MRQLLNQHDIDLPVGRRGVTVRRGLKWADAKSGDRLELMTGTGPDDQTHFGEGVVVDAAVYRFKDLPAKLLEMQHEARARQYSGLLASMRKAYGPGFSEDEDVVAMTYERTA